MKNMKITLIQDMSNSLMTYFDDMFNVGGGPYMEDHDTDPHVSMSRGVKFKSSWHSQHTCTNLILKLPCGKQCIHTLL